MFTKNEVLEENKTLHEENKELRYENKELRYENEELSLDKEKLLKDIDDMQLEFMKILAIAINKLENNSYGRDDVKNRNTLEYLKEQYKIITADIAINNDEDKIIKLPITAQSK